MPKPRKYIGDCSVDSGILMISDPCYVLSDPDDDEVRKASRPTYSKTTEALFIPYVACEGVNKPPKEGSQHFTEKLNSRYTSGICSVCEVEVETMISLLTIQKPREEWEYVIQSHQPYRRQTVEEQGCRTPDGLGVEFFPAWGDGSYPVFLEYNEDGRVIRAVIECDWSEELEDEVAD